MYFHDPTFEKQLMYDLNEYPINAIQAEHKIGRIKIFLPYDFAKEPEIILALVHKMLMFGADYQHQKTERFKRGEISIFSDAQTIMIFKEMIRQSTRTVSWATMDL